MQQETGIEANNQNDQLEREFKLQEFIEVITQLLESFQVFQKGAVNIQNIYWEIHSKNGKVLGKDIISTIQTVRQQIEEQKLIKNQIRFYRQKINELRKKGISCLSIIQFCSLFNKEGLITGQLNKHIKNVDYISLQKLQKFIEKVQHMSQKNIHIKSNIRVSSLQKSSIIHQSQIDPNQDIRLQDVQEYINTKIIDAGVSSNLSTMIKCISMKINRLQQNQQTQKQIQNALRLNLDELDNQLYNTEKLVDTKQAEIERLRTRIREQQQIFQSDNKKVQQMLGNIQLLEIQNQQFRQYIGNLTFKNEQLQTKLSWFKENYNGLIKQYQEFIKQKQEKQKKDKSQKQERLFIQRTTKQQLEDAQAKVTRLRQQNGQLKKRNEELTYDYQYKITFLQKRIQQLQGLFEANKITRKYEGSGIRNTYLSAISKVDSENFTIRGSNYSRNSKRQSELFDSHSSVIAFETIISQQSINKGFKKKKHQIQMQAHSIMTPQDQQQFQGSKAKETKQQPFHKRKTQNNINANISLNPNKLKQVEKEKMSKRMLSSLSFFIKADGQKIPTHVIVSEDRFTFLDTKKRQNYSIKFNQLRKIIFCYNNTTWMVLKIKSNQKNEKKQSLTDVVLSIQNRPYLLQFLHQRCASKLYEAGVKITFEKQNDIWVTRTESETLLSNYQNYNNINRISLGNAGHMFEGNVKFNSMFNFGTDCLLIVTSIGILAFETDGDYLLQRYQKLLYIIPLVEQMTIEISSDHRIVVKYDLQKKFQLKITMTSSSHAKKLKNIIQDQRLKNFNRKKAQIQKYQLFTAVLDKVKTS